MRPLSTILVAAGLGLAGAASALALPQTATANTPPAASVRTAAAADIRVAQLFGESDEEKAARQQHEDNQDSQIASANRKVDDLENTLSHETGQIEQLGHRIEELNSRIARMQKDFDYKLCTLAAQQLGASTDPNAPDALPCAGGGGGQLVAPRPAAPAGPPPSSQSGDEENSAPIHLAPPPGVLGTLPSNRPDNTPPAGRSGVQTGSLNGIAPGNQYEGALHLLAQAQYAEARAQFRAFADSHPDDPNAALAVYWIGDIAYLEKDYQTASRTFAEEIKKYPDSPRAARSMLKLGQSLIAMNQKKEGCTFLVALPKKYPDADPSLAAEATRARKAARCR